MKYRKKPVVIEAIQWTGKNLEEIYAFCGPGNIGPIERRMDYDLKIKTLESGGGYHIADRNDWVIKGVKGEFYPCKPDIFKMTYEKVLEREHIESPDCWCCPKLADDFTSEGGTKHYIHNEEQ